MSKKLIINALLVGLIVNMDVHAESGVYIDGNAGYGSTGGLSIHNGNFAYSGDIGYQFNTYFGLELGYNHFGKVSKEYFGYRTNQFGNYSADIAVKGILPFKDRWSLFGKLGLAYVNQQEKFSGFTTTPPPSSYTIDSYLGTLSPYAAAGVSYQLSKRFDINAQLHGTPLSPSMYAGLVGLTYHF